MYDNLTDITCEIQSRFDVCVYIVPSINDLQCQIKREDVLEIFANVCTGY